MSEVRRRTTGRQQGFDPASGLSGADGIEAFARRNRQGGGDGSGVGTVSQFDIQRITPVDGAGTGDPVLVPAGSWLMTVEASGYYDDISAGYELAVGEDTLEFGGWVAHRPSGALEEAAGSTASLPVGAGAVTPVIVVAGDGEGPVRVVVRFDPSESAPPE